MKNQETKLVGSGSTGLAGRMSGMTYAIYALSGISAFDSVEGIRTLPGTKGYTKRKLNKKQLKARAASKRARKIRKKNGRK